MITVLSLGVGHQSSALALMYELGELQPAPDYAIFADTQLEPDAVYEYKQFLERTIMRFPILTVTKGNLWESATRVRTRADGQRKYIETAIPVYLQDGLKRGKGMRACTRDFKIEPVRRKCRELLGLRAVSADSGVLVRMILGISTDEYLRAKTSPLHWIEHAYPLLRDRPTSRQGCYDWIVGHGYPPPPRSACKECPLRDDASWAALTPDELDVAARHEYELQQAYAATDHMRGVPYLHELRVPLKHALERAKENRERKLAKFNNECEGFCGV